MNPDSNHRIFMLYKSAETCHPVSLPCKGTNILILNLCWGKFLPVGMICTTTNTISIPLGEMYLHVRMFCAFAHMSSIPMGAITFYMQERFFALADITSILKFAMYLHARMFCTLALYVFYSHGCYVRTWNLFWASVAKPVLWQLMILLPCTLTQTSSIHMGAINLYLQEHFLHSLIRPDLITPIFTVITKVWPRANQAVVTNNSTMIIEVVLIEAMLIDGFLCIISSM